MCIVYYKQILDTFSLPGFKVFAQPKLFIRALAKANLVTLYYMYYNVLFFNICKVVSSIILISKLRAPSKTKAPG